MPGIANVSLTDTFDTLRIATNKLIVGYDQTYGFVTNTVSDLSNTVNVTVAATINTGNNANIFGMIYANTIGNTSNIYAMSYANTMMPYANTIANNSNSFAITVGRSSNNYGNSTFTTIANGVASFRQTNVAFTHANSAFDQANIAYTQANDAYTRANTKVATVIGTNNRIVSTGTTDIEIDLAPTGNGASNYAGGISSITVDAYGRVTGVTTVNYQPQIGFTPVQQGGGAGQANNKVYIGWGGVQLLLQIDGTNYAATWPINITGRSGTANSALFANRATLATTSNTAVTADTATSAINLSGGTVIATTGTFSGALQVSNTITSIRLNNNNDNGQLRAIGNTGSNWYSTMWKNDGANCFFLSSNPSGSLGTALTSNPNNFRPFAWNLQSGDVTIAGNGSATTIGGILRLEAGYGSAVPAYGVRVWARFTGLTILASAGVSSITQVDGLTSRVNFNFTMVDNRYAANMTLNDTFTTRWAPMCGNQQTTSCDIYTPTITRPSGGFMIVR